MDGSTCSAKGGAFFGKMSGTRRLYLLTGFLLLAAMPKQLQLQSILLHCAVTQPKSILGPFQSPLACLEAGLAGLSNYAFRVQVCKMMLSTENPEQSDRKTSNIASGESDNA